MRRLKLEELQMVEGGGISSWGVVAIIGAAISFLSGFVDGFTRPYKCR